MSPIVLIVFVPVILGGVAFVALLLGAAAAGAWEAVEGLPERTLTVAGPVLAPASQPERPRARAA